MRKLSGKVIVWPAYFDSSRTQREGRRLPLKLCVSTPTLKEIVEAAKLLGLNPQPNFSARYPRSWWTESGYVIVEKLGSKQETLRKLAEKLKEFRSKR
ncbi:signal recognition particle protein Srp19 [Candidatus Bathyarchaeota archaeon]|nr:MAG: signal recognition particle protein Srp19 [Candidatus Bathyarchaeota archaeon]